MPNRDRPVDREKFSVDREKFSVDLIKFNRKKRAVNIATYWGWNSNRPGVPNRDRLFEVVEAKGRSKKFFDWEQSIPEVFQRGVATLWGRETILRYFPGEKFVTDVLKSGMVTQVR